MNSTHLISLPVPPFRLRSHYWEFPDSMMLSPVTSTLLLSVPWRVSSSLRKSIIPCSVNLIKIALMFSPNNPNFWRARVSVVSPHSSCDVPSVMVSYNTVWFPVASRTFLGMECNILVCFNFFLVSSHLLSSQALCPFFGADKADMSPRTSLSHLWWVPCQGSSDKAATGILSSPLRAGKIWLTGWPAAFCWWHFVGWLDRY